MLVQIVLILLPALDSNEIAASAINANSNEYSTRSCPLSSDQVSLRQELIVILIGSS
jgi:hypothetical protein